jgi:transposase-like protein
LKNISKQTRRKYKEGFKTEALRMVTASRRTADIARSLGIREYLLYKW